MFGPAGSRRAGNGPVAGADMFEPISTATTYPAPMPRMMSVGRLFSIPPSTCTTSCSITGGNTPGIEDDARVQIRNRREEFGVSQQQLAEAVGVSQQAIAKIEAPDANVRLETLERVAAALGLEVDLNLIPRQAKQGAA